MMIYFHGYRSSPLSEKVTALQEIGIQVVAPFIPDSYSVAMKHLTEVVHAATNQKNVVLCGTSLGAYWANHFSNAFLIPALLINPSCNPAQTLGLTDYPHLVPTPAVSKVVLLARDDEVLDYKVAENLFKPVAKVKIFETGGHRFNCPELINKEYEQLKFSVL